MPVVGDDRSPEEPVAVAPPALPGSSRRRIAYLAGALAGGNGIAMLLRIVGGVLQARIVPVRVLGLFGSFGLVTGYLRFLQLGVLNGMNRELPYFIGRGETARVHDLAASAKAWAFCCGTFVASALSGLALWYLAHGDYQMAAGWAANALTAFLYFYADMYLQMTYRTSSDFVRLAGINVAVNILAVVLIVPVIWLGFFGLCMRAVAIALAGLWLLRMWQPIRVRAKLKVQQVKHLLFVGFPMFFVGEMGNWWRLLEGTLVFLKLGTVGMGLYQMMLYVDAATDLFPTAIGQVYFPRMVEHYGRHHDVRALFRMSHKPSLACFAVMLPIVVAGWFLAYPLARLIAPAYIGAIEAARWGLLGSIVYSFTMVHMIFNIVRRQELYCIVIGLSIAAYFVALKYLLHDGTTLVAVVQAIFLGGTQCLSPELVPTALVAFVQAMILGRVVFVVSGYLGVLYILGGAKAQL